MELLRNILYACWEVLGQMSLYLLFGFLIAGLLSVSLSREWIERCLGGRGLWPVFKAALFGIPLPLCSCSVLPVGASLHRHGASREATVGFLLSTPQTGVDSIAVTYALLGPVFAVFRPLAALITGLLGGGLIHFLDPEKEIDNDLGVEIVCNKTCCCKKEDGVLYRIFHFAFIELPGDLAGPLLLGIVLAGLMTEYIPANSLETYFGAGVFSILIMMIVGTPLYVCATASVPIAAGFIHAGASPGAALAFLIAGPATNIAALTTLFKILGKKATLLYLLTVFLSALLSALLLNAVSPMFTMNTPLMVPHQHSGSQWYEHLASGVLLLILIYAALRRSSSSPSQQ